MCEPTGGPDLAVADPQQARMVIRSVVTIYR
jgi:hypothetical protein